MGSEMAVVSGVVVLGPARVVGFEWLDAFGSHKVNLLVVGGD
jgi:hypothetical protein